MSADDSAIYSAVTSTERYVTGTQTQILPLCSRWTNFSPHIHSSQIITIIILCLTAVRLLPAMIFQKMEKNDLENREKRDGIGADFELTLIPTPFNPNKYVKRHFHSCPLFRLRLSRFFFPPTQKNRIVSRVCFEWAYYSLLYMFGLVFSLAFFSSSHCHNNISNGKRGMAEGKKEGEKSDFPEIFFILFHWKYYHRDFHISTRGSSREWKSYISCYFVGFCGTKKRDERQQPMWSEPYGQ